MDLKQATCPNCLSVLIEERDGKLFCKSCRSAFTKGRYAFHDAAVQSKFDRAVEKRTLLKFDDSLEILDNLIEYYPEYAELYYQRVLSKVGAQFVEENNETKITISRLIREPIHNLTDVKKALELAETSFKQEYEHTFGRLEEIRSSLIRIVEKAPNYDVFISFKEHPDGQKDEYTADYMVAKEIYEELTRNGLKVFFAPKSLVAGTDYEPYIYQALESSEVMLLVCATTDPSKDYVNSPWVKNEWSRFYAMTKSATANKYLIPVLHNGYSPENLPGVLSKLQCLTYDAKFWKNLDTTLKQANVIKLKPVKDKPVYKQNKFILMLFAILSIIACITISLTVGLSIAGKDSNSNGVGDTNINNNNSSNQQGTNTNKIIQLNRGYNLQMCVGDTYVVPNAVYGFTPSGEPEEAVFDKSGYLSYDSSTNELTALKEGKITFALQADGIKSNTITVFVYKINYMYEGKMLEFHNKSDGYIISTAIVENPIFSMEECLNPEASYSPVWKLNFEADLTKTYGGDGKMRMIVKMYDENEQLIAQFHFDTPNLPVGTKKHIKVTNINATKFYKLNTNNTVVVAEICTVNL